MFTQLKLLLYLQSIRSPLLTYIFLTFTMSIETPVVILFSSILYWTVDKVFGMELLFNLSTNITLNSGLKDLIRFPRPIGSKNLTSLHLPTATGYSFPSGHTQIATTFWESMMLHFKHSYMYIIGTIFIICIGFSRIYLGVHWPTDVIGAIVTGTMCTLLCHKAFNYILNTKKNSILIYIYIPFLIICFILKDGSYIKVAGLYGGLILGYILESKFVKFSTKVPLKDKIMRGLLGILSLFLFYLALDYTFPSYLILIYLKYFATCCFAIAFVPYMFTIFHI
ncbi:PAP2 superfamily protein [Hathewaya proteolytica DSM 3090]|uniref:PAP2 superfamily protein n=1 Tax=Hathewaya proteolytica DSM 3090 TaxID=1121331 RepID=A0A1M6QDV3_9CLOT|nr:phosphatase PAP2 family protein [Hathewaya proteolytica]SHK18257.1 PAP2 superfamily protein [Hathewaya proteolytica DSM 3090]